MAVVTTTAPTALPDSYTGSAGVCTGQTIAVAFMPTDPGVTADLPVYGKPSPRQNVPLSPQAARWLFPPYTTVPVSSPFTRYPIAA